MHSQRRRVQHRDPDDPPDRANGADRHTESGLSAARITWPMDRQAAATFPGRPDAVATARRFVRITGAMWQLNGETLEDAELCISELVGNAVTHTTSPRVHCRLWSARGVLFLEVDDEGNRDSTTPVVESATAEDETGRGMLLIQTFTAAWGTAPRLGLDGKTVWAALLLPTA